MGMGGGYAIETEKKKGKYSAFCDDRAEVDREEQKSRKVQS